MFKTYKEAYEYFYGKKNHYWDLGLDNIRNFLKYFGSPENKINIIQVAGTNGKGSICEMLASVLENTEYKVGKFISPHLIRFNDGIYINLSLIHI